MNEIEKAEFIQSVKAFAIPVSLFLATVTSAAGTFLIYNGYALGWIFVGLALTVMGVAFTAFIRFQNKLRADGHLPEETPMRSELTETTHN